MRRELRLLRVLACLAVGALAPGLAAAQTAPAAASPDEVTPSAAISAVAPVTTPAVSPEGLTSAERAELQELRSQTRALAERLDQLEQARLQADLALTDDAAQQEIAEADLFRIYGFADFGINRVWVGKKSLLHGLIPTDATFALGNLNLYFDFTPGPQWQVLTEVRFSSYPHGVEEELEDPSGREYRRTDTSVVDVASTAPQYEFRWGSVSIERAYAQYSHSELLNVRVGQFLTPYGIWNVDHGTPTLIALMLPHFVAAEVFPTRQIGVEVHGSSLQGAWELGYNAYVSNGRTATQIDFTDNKAVGLRFKVGRMLPLPFVAGTSFYFGQIDDVQKRVTSLVPFHVTQLSTVEGTEWGVGLDVSLDVGALRLRTEAIMRQRRFEDGKRPPINFGRPGSLEPDRNEYDSYLLGAYRLPWLGLEPFAYGELNHIVSLLGDEQAIVGGGLNVHFTPFASLKTQLARAMFFDLEKSGSFSDSDMTLLYSRLVVAF